MRIALTTFALIGALAATSAARADDFNFSYSGAGVTESGVLPTVEPFTGTFLITGISGTRNGASITGLSSFDGADNLLFATDPILTFDGFSYTTASDSYNVFFSGFDGEVNSYVEEDSEGNDITITIAPLTSATPEPSSLVLLGSGMLAAAGAARRRFMTK